MSLHFCPSVPVAGFLQVSMAFRRTANSSGQFIQQASHPRDNPLGSLHSIIDHHRHGCHFDDAYNQKNKPSIVTYKPVLMQITDWLAIEAPVSYSHLRSTRRAFAGKVLIRGVCQSSGVGCCAATVPQSAELQCHHPLWTL